MISKFISIKGLKTYVFFITALLAGYFYIQLNGIQLYNSTKTEHDKDGNSYGNSNHK